MSKTVLLSTMEYRASEGTGHQIVQGGDMLDDGVLDWRGDTEINSEMRIE